MWCYQNPVDVRIAAGVFKQLDNAVGNRPYAFMTYDNVYFDGLAAGLKNCRSR